MSEQEQKPASPSQPPHSGAANNAAPKQDAPEQNPLTQEDFENLGMQVPHDPRKTPVEEEVNRVHSHFQHLQDELSSLVHNHEDKDKTAFERCLRSLLIEMKWPGEDRHIMEAMPHFRELNDVPTFRGVVHHLGFKTRILDIPSNLLSARLPCLILDDEDKPLVGLRISANERILAFSGETGDVGELNLPDDKIRICVIEKQDDVALQPRGRKTSWFYEGLRKFNSKIWLVVGLTFMANILALATPIFTMNVYNRVIDSKSLDTLMFFLSAILITLCFEMYLRHVRGRLIAYIGARFNTQLLIAGFQRILGLPISMTESASVSQQIVRLRQFENVQSFFTGPLVSAVLDLPFTIVFIIAISLIHPLLALVPVALALAFVLIGMVSMPVTKRNVLITGKSRQNNQNLLIETVNKRDSIRQLRGEDVWIRRWDESGSEFASRRFNAQFFDTIMHTLSQSLVMIAGIVTLWVGALLVMDAALSVGALIAVMMFVWRVLSPIQTAFLSLNRVGQFIETAKQADLLMSLPLERQSNQAPTLRRNYKGHIIFNNVSFRYGSSGDPVFRGLSLEVKPGQVLAVTGEAAGGKSSLLKLVLGLYKPQSGNVFIDGLNLQQLDVDEVRTSIGYVPQRQEFFYGTLAQNIRLASPSASDKDIEDALSDAGIWLPHPQLEDGIETRLTGHKLSILPNPLKQSISLARAFVKRDSMYLLDAPTNFMNTFEEQAFFDKVQSLRGKATIIVATDSDSLIRQCDRVVYLKGGTIVFDDTPDVFLKAKAMSKQKAG